MMGKWLARLKNQTTANMHATKPTKPAQGEGGIGFVGSVAYPLACLQELGLLDRETVKPPASMANDGVTTESVPATDPDQSSWPHTQAMNTSEIGTHMARLARFTEKGMSLEDAEKLADRLLIRDREGDDRRVCVECAYLDNKGRCLAAVIGRLQYTSGWLEPAKDALQRCPAFGSRKGLQ